MSLPNAIEALNRVITVLATDSGMIKDRMKKAWKNAYISDDDFPEELRAEWLSIRKELEKYGPRIAPDGTQVKDARQNTIRRIRSSTASRLAARILEFYFVARNSEEGSSSTSG